MKCNTIRCAYGQWPTLFLDLRVYGQMAAGPQAQSFWAPGRKPCINVKPWWAAFLTNSSSQLHTEEAIPPGREAGALTFLTIPDPEMLLHV